MKVILLIPHVSGGGGEKVLSELARGLRAEVVVVVFERKFSYEITGKLISLDTPINRTSSTFRAYGFLRRILQFRRILQKEQPDAVLSFMGEANLINALVSRRPILSVHAHLSAISTIRNRIEALAVNILIPWLYGKATVVAVSEAVKRDLVENFRVSKEQVVVIPNGVDLVDISKLAHEPVDCPWNVHLPVIVTAGRLCREKAQWHLMRAFAEARKKRSCQLAILGSGELENDLKTLAKELAVEDDVFFLGWQSNPFKYMSRADIFVLSSLTEAFPLVLLEAMACRLPVIATDSPGGAREILTGGAAGVCGILVPPPDGTMHGGSDPCTAQERQLADQLTRMLEDQDTRQHYIEAGLLRVRDFDMLNFLEKYQQLLETTAATASR